MKIAGLAAAAAVTLLVALPGAFQPGASQPLERAFARGGHIRLNLAAGDYRIVGRPADKIVVRWRLDKLEDADKVRAEADIRGTTATIRTTGPHNGLHFEIDVPDRSDIDLDLSAGDLQVRGIEGSKNVSAWAGDLSIDIGRAELYRDVEASVRMGDLSAAPFNVSKGGLFRSFKWSGGGKYSLRVKLFAGDLVLR